MYKKALREKLEEIFKFQQCEFGMPIESKTQNCAWIMPEPANLSFSGDKRTCFVSGEIVVVNPPERMPLGRLYEKYQLAKESKPGTFRITTAITEGFDYGATQLTAQKFGFIFEYSEQYNPPKPLSGLRWLWNHITQGNNNG